jgi:hypothetical protein
MYVHELACVCRERPGLNPNQSSPVLPFAGLVCENPFEKKLCQVVQGLPRYCQIIFQSLKLKKRRENSILPSKPCNEEVDLILFRSAKTCLPRRPEAPVTTTFMNLYLFFVSFKAYIRNFKQKRLQQVIYFI